MDITTNCNMCSWPVSCFKKEKKYCVGTVGEMWRNLDGVPTLLPDLDNRTMMMEGSTNVLFCLGGFRSEEASCL
jgi:hypothetical protein